MQRVLILLELLMKKEITVGLSRPNQLLGGSVNFKFYGVPSDNLFSSRTQIKTPRSQREKSRPQNNSHTHSSTLNCNQNGLSSSLNSNSGKMKRVESSISSNMVNYEIFCGRIPLLEKHNYVHILYSCYNLLHSFCVHSLDGRFLGCY